MPPSSRPPAHPGPPSAALRVLVAIANHGTRNAAFLTRLLAAYRAMPFRVDVVVLSDVAKDLGPDVEVRVGAPTSDPWSLPFAHRPLFAERVDDYDLFVYSEDDTLVTAANLAAFLEIDQLLADDEVPGFLRYERHPDGARSYDQIHSGYRWRPETVTVRAGLVFADYTNDHAACYALTRAHLRRALASGGFLVPPHEGTYDLLVSAATDPYTRCGLRKLLCVSRLDDVLVHHLPNVYLDRYGASEAEVAAQRRGLERIAAGGDRRSLLEPRTRLDTWAWDVPCHRGASPAAAGLAAPVPPRALAFATASGRFERQLLGPACAITGIPVDAVFGEMAGAHGLAVTSPDLDDALEELDGQRFPLVVVSFGLGHVPDPAGVLGRLAAMLDDDGRMVIVLRNHRFDALRHRLRRRGAPAPPRAGFRADGVHRTDAGVLRRWLRAAGLRPGEVRYEIEGRTAGRLPAWTHRWVGRWSGSLVIATARPRQRAAASTRPRRAQRCSSHMRSTNGLDARSAVPGSDPSAMYQSR